jgi:hypothetical protein
VLDDTITVALAASLVASTIDGGAGLDTLTITPTFGAFNATALWSNLETVNLTAGNTAALQLPTTLGLDVVNNSSTGAATVTLGTAANTQTVTSASSGLTTVNMNAATASTVTVSGTGGVTATAVGGGVGQTITNTGAGVSTVTASGAVFTFNGGSGADTLNLPNATYTATASGGTGAADVFAPTGTAVLAQGMTLSAFEVLDLTAAGVTVNVTMTPTQHALFTSVTSAGGDDVITLASTAATTITGLASAAATTLTYALPAVVNTFTAAATAMDYLITGGAAIDTFNMGALMTAADQINGAGGVDVLNITGNAVGDAAFTNIEDINVTYATAATFTTGAMAPGAASTINASTSAAAVTLDLTGYVPTATLVVTDGQAGDTITNVSTDAINLLTTIDLSSGGSDTINYTNTFNATANSELSITNFTSGAGAGADKLIITTGALQTAGFTTIAAGNTVVPLINQIYEVTSTVATVTDFTAVADGGAVEVAIATALNGITMTAVASTVIVYGAGASAGSAGIYNFLGTGAVATTGAFSIELIGIVEVSGGADSLVISNFI